jgi:hypothetical protein
MKDCLLLLLGLDIPGKMSWTHESHDLLSDSLANLPIYYNRFLARRTLILKMEAEFAYKTLVSVYKQHDVRIQKTANQTLLLLRNVKFLCREKKRWK